MNIINNNSQSIKSIFNFCVEIKKLSVLTKTVAFFAIGVFVSFYLKQIYHSYQQKNLLSRVKENDKKIINNIDFTKERVHKEGKTPLFQDNKEIFLDAFKQDPQAILDISPKLLEDTQFLIELTNKNIWANKNSELKIKFVELIFEKYPNHVEIILKNWLEDKFICKQLTPYLNKNEKIIDTIRKIWLYKLDVSLRNLENNRVVSDIIFIFENDNEMMKSMIINYSKHILYIYNEDFEDDSSEDNILCNGWDEIKDWLYESKIKVQRGIFIENLIKENSQNENLLHFANDNCTYALQHMNKELAQNREFAKEIIRENGKALEFFPFFSNDYEIATIAYTNKLNVDFIDKSILESPDFIKYKKSCDNVTRYR